MIRYLQLEHYRNYESLELDLSPSIQIFYGKNAQGKTNILESIYFASIGRSHRTQDDSDLISWGQNQARIDLETARFGVPRRLRFNLSRGRSTRIFSNELPIRRSDLIGRLKTVLFSPEDLSLIKGSPNLRRRFLDIELSQASPKYYRDLIDYRHVIDSRNLILKRIREKSSRKLKDMLEVWNEEFVTLATRIVQRRIDATQRFSTIAAEFHSQISGGEEDLQIKYHIHGARGKIENYEEWIISYIESNRENEIYRGSTEIGAHRDDLRFSINEVNAKNFSSQGQQRTAALSIKLAELEFLNEESGEYPVLLLDDVMSELDSNRRRQLLDFLLKRKIQTLITATDATIFPTESVDAKFEVRSGQIFKNLY